MIFGHFTSNRDVFAWLGTWPERIWLGEKSKPGVSKAQKDAASDNQGLESVGRTYVE